MQNHYISSLTLHSLSYDLQKKKSICTSQPYNVVIEVTRNQWCYEYGPEHKTKRCYMQYWKKWGWQNASLLYIRLFRFRSSTSLQCNHRYIYFSLFRIDWLYIILQIIFIFTIFIFWKKQRALLVFISTRKVCVYFPSPYSNPIWLRFCVILVKRGWFFFLDSICIGKHTKGLWIELKRNGIIERKKMKVRIWRVYVFHYLLLIYTLYIEDINWLYRICANAFVVHGKFYI